MRRSVQRALWVSFCLFVFVDFSSSHALEVPLLLRERAGVERRGEIVTVGVPIAKGTLSSSQAVAIEGRDGQFETLATWGDGSVKWLLASFPVDLAVNAQESLRLVDGPGNAPPAELSAVESSGQITVSTGPLRFTARESPFNLFDEVWLDSNGDRLFGPAERIVSSRTTNGSIVEDRNGVTFTSGNASDVELILEESGPLRVVIFFRGTHRNGAATHLQFSGRIYAYRGQSYVKVQYSETNSLPTGVTNWQPDCLYLAGRGPHGGSSKSLFFEDLSVVTRVDLAGPLRFALQGAPGTTPETGALQESASLYQDSSGETHWSSSPDVTFRGYELRRGATTLASGTKARGFADLNDGTRGLTIAIRHFWENFPNKVMVSPDGTAKVSVMPREFSAPFEHRPGEKKTHWTLFYFHTGNEIEARSAGIATSFHEPLRATLPAAYYAASGAFDDFAPYDAEAFPDYELHNWHAARGFLAKRVESDYFGWMHFGDLWADQEGGSPPNTNKACANLEYDAGYASIVQSLRTSGLDDETSDLWWKLAEEGNSHTADIDIYHVTEGPLPWMWGAMWVHTYGSGFDDPHRGNSPNTAHAWNRGLLNGYFLTGDRNLLEAAVEVGENIRFRVMNGPGGPGYSEANGEERAPGHALQILTDMYLFTWDETYLAAARKLVHESRPDAYPYYSSPDSGNWRVKPWMIAILAKSLGRFAHVMRQERGSFEDEAIESLRTRCEFLEHRCWYDREGSNPSYLPYQVHGNGGNDDATVTMWSVRASDAFTWGYRFEDDPEKRSRYFEIARHAFEDGSLHPWCGSCPNRRYTTAKTHQVLAGSGQEWMAESRASAPTDATPPSAIEDLEASPGKGQGEIRLNWTAPGDDGNSGRASSYELRRAETGIETETDWGKAHAVTPLPAPAPAGTRETLTLGELEPGSTWYFAIRALDDVGRRAELSNSANASAGLDRTAPEISLLGIEFALGEATVHLEASEPAWGAFLWGIEHVAENWILLGAFGSPLTRFAAVVAPLREGTAYRYRVVLVDEAGNVRYLDDTLDVPSEATPPFGGPPAFVGAHPNPVRSGSPTSFFLPGWSDGGSPFHGSLEIFDLLGRRVRLVWDGTVSSSQGRRVVWDGRDEQGNFVSSGVYFSRFLSESGVAEGRVLVVR